MKKHLLAIAFLGITAAANAGNFSITDASSVNVAGTTQTYNIVASSTDSRIFTVMNNNATQVNVKVRKTVIQQHHPSSTTWFCTDLNCYAPTTTLSPSFAMAASGTFDLTIDIDPYNQTGVSEVRYAIINQMNTSDTSFVTVIYNIGPAGIANNVAVKASISNPMPNPASAQFSMTYKLGSSSTAGAKLMVYNMLGAVVMETEITSAEGTVRMDVSTLDQGVYFCSLVSDGKTHATRRLVVSH
jgi:hypothetical protein